MRNMPWSNIWLHSTKIFFAWAIPTSQFTHGAARTIETSNASSRISPTRRLYLLEESYRSHQNILDTAMSVIDRASNRHKKRLFSDRGAGEKIFFHEAYNDYDEASFVVDTIAQLVASKQFEPGDCAVMYRTNSMSRLLEEAFLQARLPYRLVGAQRFYGRREVKDMIAFIRLVHNPADEAALGRIINVPPRGIGEKTLTTLHLVANQENITPGAVLA